MNDWLLAFKRVTIAGFMASVVVIGVSLVLGMQEGLSDAPTPDFILTILGWLWVACLLTVVIGGTGWLLAWLKTKL